MSGPKAAGTDTALIIRNPKVEPGHISPA